MELKQGQNPDNGDTYNYVEEPDKVCVLPYIRNNDGTTQIVVLVEPITIWKNNRKAEIVSVTGTIDEGEDHKKASRRELQEETGIEPPEDDMWSYVGNFSVGKGVRSNRHLYLVDVTGRNTEVKETDGSWFERNTKIIVSDIRPIQKMSVDIVLHILIDRLNKI